MDKLPISLCVVTLNEEANIRRCLRSAPFASDIVILDSGSVDQTKEIAISLGARVFDEPWRGYGPQKKRAVELAHHDWVLCLDADEELSESLQAEIVSIFKEIYPLELSNNHGELVEGGGPLSVSPRHKVQNSNKISGFRAPRKSFHLGRWLFYGGWYPDYQTRFFNRKLLQWSEDRVHESVKGDKIATLKKDINHYPFSDLADQIQTNNKYSSLGAETLSITGKRVKLWHLLFKPWIKFIELYFAKQGFRDGIPGYIIAVGAAYSYFLKYAKLWEMQALFPKTDVEK